MAPAGGSVSSANGPGSVLVGGNGSTLNSGSGQDTTLEHGSEATVNGDGGQVGIDGISDLINDSNAVISAANAAASH